ncbi:MAG: hypothetical protein ACXAC7_07715 [Candidatus Hodarchaeales archaeon]|jgi:hypothetical protein
MSEQEIVTPVKRIYQVGLSFKGETPAVRREKERFANNIIRNYQYELFDKLSPERINKAITFLRHNRGLSGTYGTSLLRGELNDCSNLGEAAYLPLLQSVKAMFTHEEHMQTFLKMICHQSDSRFEWLLFGRSPYLERGLQYKLGCTFDHARNLSNETRLKLDKYLPREYRLKVPLPQLSFQDLEQAIDQFYQKIESEFEVLEQQEKLSKWQIPFRKKVRIVHQHRSTIIISCLEAIKGWNTPTKITPSSRWRLLKRLSRHVGADLSSLGIRVKDPLSYHSVLRAIFTSAYCPFYPDKDVILNWTVNTPPLRASILVTKPFSSIRKKKKPRRKRKLPLQLLMKHQYVVLRPGNGKSLTEFASTIGKFTIFIYPYRKKRFGVWVTIPIHQSIQHFIHQGAQITTLTLVAGDAPSERIKAFVRMKGPKEAFYSKRRVEQLIDKWKFPSPPVKAIGVDVNRVSEFVLAFSENFSLSEETKKNINRYLHLKKVIAQLQLGCTRKRNDYYLFPSSETQKAWIKTQGELERVYDRQKRLLMVIHQYCVIYITAMLIHHQSNILCHENLQISARGKRGALAQAILNMPDDEQIFVQSAWKTEWITGNTVQIISVDPRNTSNSSHYHCCRKKSGKLQRTSQNWDIAKCSACHEKINVHDNSALHIRDRGLKKLPQPS